MQPAAGGLDRVHGAARGVGVAAGLIARTLGPAGRPALLRGHSGADIEAADAETIVAHLTPDDPSDAVGVGYVRDLVRDQRAAAPDGAATAVVLAAAMVARAIDAVDAGADPVGLARGIEAARDRVLNELGRRAAALRTKEEIASVMAAAVFDRPLANLLAEAFDKVGKEGVITVEPVAEPGLVLAAGVSGEALEALAAAGSSGDCAALAIVVPGDRRACRAVLGDLAVVTGGCVVGAMLSGSSPGGGGVVGGGVVGDSAGGGAADWLASDVGAALGRAEKVVATRDRTVIVGGAGDRDGVTDRVRQIRAEIESADSATDRDELFSRLSRLAGGAATVRAGGATGGETARLVARAERGLQIARLAMECPIAAGGGAALADVQHALAKFPRSVPGGRSGDQAAGARIVLDSLTAPIRQLAGKAGVPPSAIDRALKSRKEGCGIDPGTGQTVPMRPHAVDLLPVLQAAVANATALTVRILTG